MVTPQEWDGLRLLNFGVRTMTLPIDVANVRSQIRRYDPAGCAAISARVRSEATLGGAVDQLIHLYRDIVQRFPQCRFDPALGQMAAAQYLRSHAPVFKGHAALLAAAEAREPLLAAEARESSLAAENALAQASLTQARYELDCVRNSATWRLARSVLENPLLRFLSPVVKRAGSLIRGKQPS